MKNICSGVLLGSILILSACGGGTESGTRTTLVPQSSASAACAATIATAAVNGSNISVQTQATNFNPSANDGDTTLCQGLVNDSVVFSSVVAINGDLANCGGDRPAPTVNAGDTFQVQYTWQGATCTAGIVVVTAAESASRPSPSESADCTARISTAEVSGSSSIFVQTLATSFNPAANDGDTTLCRGFVNNVEIFEKTAVINGNAATCGGLEPGSVNVGDTFQVQYNWRGAACSDSQVVVADATPPVPKLTCSGDPPPGGKISATDIDAQATVTLTDGSDTTADYVLFCNGTVINNDVRTLNSGIGVLLLNPAIAADCPTPGDVLSIRWTAQGLSAECEWEVEP